MSETLTWQLVRGRFDWKRPSTITSPIIGYFGADYYSHIDVLTPKGMLRGARSDVIKGIPAGYQDRPQNYEKWAKCTRFSLEVSLGTWVKYWEFSDKQLGKPYDAHGLIETYVFANTRWARKWRDQDSWWCSEEVGANWEYARMFELPPEKRLITPGDCAMVLTGARAKREEMAC